MSILSARNLVKIYKMGVNEVHALNGLSLDVNEKEFLAIVGSSGSGKSTFLNMLGGLDRPTSGEVIINGKNIFSLSDEDLAVFRRRNIGFIFQNYNLVPVLNVYDNIVMPVKLDGQKPNVQYIKNIMEVLGIADKSNALPNMLSGGQQQRVAIARALANKPAIILADEPTGNLDAVTSRNVLDLLRTTSREFSQTILMITHDDELAEYADRCVRIEDGALK